MPFAHIPRLEVLKPLADAKPVPFWLDDRERPEPASALTESATGDLCVIGAGFTRLWSALLAQESDPGPDVVLLEPAKLETAPADATVGL